MPRSSTAAGGARPKRRRVRTQAGTKPKSHDAAECEVPALNRRAFNAEPTRLRSSMSAASDVPAVAALLKSLDASLVDFSAGHLDPALSGQAQFLSHTRTVASGIKGRLGPTLRRAEALRPQAPLRFPIGARWGAVELGGAEGTQPRSCRQAPRRARRRPCKPIIRPICAAGAKFVSRDRCVATTEEPFFSVAVPSP